jgi:hypothetical protein
MSQGNVGRVWLKFIDISTQQNTYSWWSVNCFSQTCRQENHDVYNTRYIILIIYNTPGYLCHAHSVKVDDAVYI